MKFFRSAAYGLSLVAAGAAFAGFAIVSASSQNMPPNGRMLYTDNCATCHGTDGRGMLTPAEVGFDLPLPNFTDCNFASREASADWSAIVHRGGPVRGFLRTMPAFDQALSDAEIDAVVAYVKGFCTDKRYPPGEFNLPLALFTEKAFPEDEVVWKNAFATEGPRSMTTTVIYEKRFGPRGQIEIALPFSSMDASPGPGSINGIGDVAVAWKQNIFASLDTGTIVSLLGETVWPTGSTRKGLGSGSVVFETHVLFAQLFPNDIFIQGQVFAGFPLRTNLTQEVGFRMAFGKTFGQDAGFGRIWSPMVEILSAHELATGAQTNWDIVPQMQVSLASRQHIRFNAGARIPLNDQSRRDTQFLFYILWDWFDGGLTEGW